MPANLGMAQAAVATLGTAMVVGLGFLPRPSRASLLWSLAFVLAMVSTAVTLAGEALAVEPLRRAGLGMLLGSPSLIWSGFRARRRVRAFPWIAPVQSGITAFALISAGSSPWYGLEFRILFFCAAVFAGLTLVEIRRSADRHEPLVLPLVLVSGAFVILGVLVLVSGLLFPPTSGDDLSLVRTLNSLGMLIYLVCATVTLVFLTSVSPVGAQTASSWPQFTVTAGDRLRRARRRSETSWALLVIRLDDPGEIRSAAGEASFGRIAERFDATVRAAFPAEADIGREGRGRLVVLLSRPGPVVREHIRDLLREVSGTDAAQQIAVQLSASVGWAPADVVGYDLTSLLTAAQEAADRAAALGGDRWERVGA